MDMSPDTPLNSDEVRAEFCGHCEAQPGTPCANFGAPGEPMPAGYEFHTQRVQAAVARARRQTAADCCQFHGLGGDRRHGCGSDAKPRTGPRPRLLIDKGGSP